MNAAAMPTPAPMGPLLAMEGTRCDLGFDATCVQKVLEPSEIEADAPVIDLFARLGEGARDGGRIVVITRGARGRLLVRAPGALSMVTPRAVLPLPRLVTKNAPFLQAVADIADGAGAADTAGAADGANRFDLDGDVDTARPLFVVALDAIV